MTEEAIVDVVENEMNEERVRSWMVEKLREGVVVVTFTKANGEKRVMTCTLNEAEIPEDQIPSGESSSTNFSDETVRVFDTEKNGWRSFRVDSVTQFDAD